MATTISPIYLYTAFLGGHPRCKRPFKIPAKVSGFNLMVVFLWVKSLAPLVDNALDIFRLEKLEDSSIKDFFKYLMREVFTHDPKPDLNSNSFDWSIFFTTSPPYFN